MINSKQIAGSQGCGGSGCTSIHGHDQVGSSNCDGEKWDTNQWPVPDPSESYRQRGQGDANDKRKQESRKGQEGSKEVTNQRDEIEKCNDRCKQQVQAQYRKDDAKRAEDLVAELNLFLLLFEVLLRLLDAVNKVVHDLLKQGCEAQVDELADVAEDQWQPGMVRLRVSIAF